MVWQMQKEQGHDKLADSTKYSLYLSVEGIRRTVRYSQLLYILQNNTAMAKTHSASPPVITVRPAAEPTTPSWQNRRDVTEGQNRPSWSAAVAVRQKREIKPIRFSDGGLEPFFTPPRQFETGSSPVSESCLPWVSRHPQRQKHVSRRPTTDLCRSKITCTNGATLEATNKPLAWN